MKRYGFGPTCSPGIKGGVSGAPTFGFLGECQREAPSEEQHGRVEADGVLGSHLTPVNGLLRASLGCRIRP